MLKLYILPALILYICVYTEAQTTKNYAVSIHATTQESPAQISLYYAEDIDATSYSIYRKLSTASSWGSLIDTLSITDSVYVDSTVSVGVSYEYRIIKQGISFTGYGYINAGIKVPVIENRGQIILVVDSCSFDFFHFSGTHPFPFCQILEPFFSLMLTSHQYFKIL